MSAARRSLQARHAYRDPGTPDLPARCCQGRSQARHDSRVTGSSVNTGNGRIQMQMSNSVAFLADELSKVAGRDVIDKTGITGRYNLKLRWAPDDQAVPASDSSASTAGDSAPSLFTALDEQLGLKLEPLQGSGTGPRHRPCRNALGQLRQSSPVPSFPVFLKLCLILSDMDIEPPYLIRHRGRAVRVLNV